MSVFVNTSDPIVLRKDIEEKFKQAIENDDRVMIFNILIPAIQQLNDDILAEAYPPGESCPSFTGIWSIAFLAESNRSLCHDMLMHLDLDTFREFFMRD